MNDSSNQLQFTQCLKTVQFRRNLQATSKATPQATPQATPDANQSKHATTTTTTTMKEICKDPQPPYRYDTLQLSFLTTHYESADDYTDVFPLYTVPHYITRKKHRSHDNYLYRRWNNPTVSSTKKTRKTNQRTLTRSTAKTKDDPSVTSTLETLSTLDTRYSHPTNIDNDTILSLTIWNQPIVQYQLPIRPFASRHRSREHPSTAVQYALIGVYDKLLNPSTIPCLLLFFNSIICVVLSCFILLADSFTMVKIDDRYPDEWND